MTSAYISTLIGIVRNECRLDDVLRQARGSLAMDSDLATRWAKDHRTRNQNSPRISIEDRNGDDVYTDTCPAGTIWTTEPMLPNMTKITASQKTVELYRRYQDMDSTIKALDKIAGILKKDELAALIPEIGPYLDKTDAAIKARRQERVARWTETRELVDRLTAEAESRSTLMEA